MHTFVRLKNSYWILCFSIWIDGSYSSYPHPAKLIRDANLLRGGISRVSKIIVWKRNTSRVTFINCVTCATFIATFLAMSTQLTLFLTSFNSGMFLLNNLSNIYYNLLYLVLASIMSFQNDYLTLVIVSFACFLLYIYLKDFVFFCFVWIIIGSN